MNILPTKDTHYQQIEDLLDTCFGKDRKSRTAYILRHGSKPISSLSFIAQKDKGLIGSISCSLVVLKPIEDDSLNAPISLIMLGPIAISPHHQNIGVGYSIITKVTDTIQNSLEYQNKAMILIGDYEYYSRFGFCKFAENEWQLPGAFDKERLLIKSDNELPIKGILSAKVSTR